MGDKNKLVVKGAVEFQEVLAYLENIVNTLKDGKVNIQKGQESIILTPPPIVDFKIEASQKKDKSKLSIKIGWEKDAKYGIQDAVNISSETPDETAGQPATVVPKLDIS